MNRRNMLTGMIGVVAGIFGFSAAATATPPRTNTGFTRDIFVYADKNPDGSFTAFLQVTPDEALKLLKNHVKTPLKKEIKISQLPNGFLRLEM